MKVWKSYYEAENPGYTTRKIGFGYEDVFTNNNAVLKSDLGESSTIKTGKNETGITNRLLTHILLCHMLTVVAAVVKYWTA